MELAVAIMLGCCALGAGIAMIAVRATPLQRLAKPSVVNPRQKVPLRQQ